MGDNSISNVSVLQIKIACEKVLDCT